MSEKPPYPPARRGDAVDDYHGTLVADPYRWLEDEESAERQAFIEAQNALTRDYLDGISAREPIEARLRELWDYPRYSVPRKRGGRYFYLKNDGLQDQAVLYWQETLEDEPRLLLDPNQLSEDGTVALVNFAPSRDGRLLAYALSSKGSDWQEISVMEVESGEPFSDRLQWVKFTNIAWAPDGSGFFYSRYPEPRSMPGAPPSTHHRLYWHALGTGQSEDDLVCARPDAPDLGFDPTVTEDGAYLVLRVWRGTDNENRVYYRPLAGEGAGSGDFIRLLDEADARYEFAGNEGRRFFFNSDQDAPRGRIIAVDLDAPARENWEEIVPEGEEAVHFARLLGGRLVVGTVRHAAHRIALYTPAGEPAGEIELPDLGSIAGLSGRQADDELFLNFQSFLFPPTIFRYEIGTGVLAPWQQPSVAFDADPFATEQIFYPSADGTRVPLFIVKHKDVKLDGARPTLLYGYGGFNINLMPTFSVSWLVFLEQGGVLAVANLRGGGEYGEEWHRAGMLEKKQNVFDDFIAAAEWLISNDYTNNKRLAIMGGSNGGLLVAACMVQRPDLFGAVVCRVPVADMLRYHRFTAGRYWTGEYGNAEEEAGHFRFLYAYSPLHNVEPGVSYPPTLIATADTDDRVVPMHALKLAATLQAADAGPHPTLLRLETAAGHGLGKPTSKVIEETADIYAFLFETLEME